MIWLPISIALFPEKNKNKKIMTSKQSCLQKLKRHFFTVKYYMARKGQRKTIKLENTL